MPHGGLAKEAADIVMALAIAAILGLSLFLDARGAFRMSVMDAIAICTTAFLAHEMAHKLCARSLAGGGRFMLATTGSMFSLLIAGLQHLVGFAMSFVGLPMERVRLAPYRFIAPGTVAVGGRKKRETLGKIALAGPASNVALGWLAFFIGLQSPRAHELLLIGSAVNAYVAFTALLPLAFCDGLTIYWWSRTAYAASLTSSVALMIASNFILLTSP